MPSSAPFLTLSELYLNVPFEEKDAAKERGAKWNKEKRLWYAPTGLDPLEFRRWWAFLGPAYEDKEELKNRGVKWTPEVKKWLVPSRLDFDDFAHWWPRDLKQYIFQERFVCYELIEESGQSTVFKAWDIAGSCWVAVKLFNAEIGSNPTSAVAFKREHTALLNLDGHENILELLDWGEHEASARKFTVMPWIDHTLEDVFKSKEDVSRAMYRSFAKQYELNISEDEFVAEMLAEIEENDDDVWFSNFDFFLGPILDGLVHAFDRKIIHRDLKPANIFWMGEIWEDEDEEFQVKNVLKLADFGSSKTIGLEVSKQKTVADLYTQPWTPFPSEKEMIFQNTWDVFSWGVMAIAFVTEKKPDTYKDTKKFLDTIFKDKVGENLHTLLSRVVSMEPEERPQDVKLLQKYIFKLNKKRRKALGIK